MNLKDLRTEIDKIDKDIVKLISERVSLAQEIGNTKKQRSSNVVDLDRERKVLENVVKAGLKQGVAGADIEKIYSEIISACRGVQVPKVAFQGEAGAYAEEAAIKYFGSPAQITPFGSLEEVFGVVQDEEFPFSIVPIENSLEGSVGQALDLLLESDVQICGEIQIAIRHCLIALPGSSLSTIKRIYSHPQAIAQCQRFLKHINCEIVPAYNTAGSAKMIREGNLIGSAAIASARAARVYEMKVLATDMEDYPRNFTRFLILSRRDAAPTGNDKTSVIFSTVHKAGTLQKALSIFSKRNINVTKIESRPTRQNPWEYNFYLDMEGHRKEEQVREALESLNGLTIFVKVLGSYPRSEKKA